MLLIENRQFRQQLNEVMERDSIEEEVLQRLRNESNSHAPFLQNALNYFLKKKDVPTHWRRLVKDLSKKSPICGLIQCSANNLEQIIELLHSEKVFEEMLYEIRETCPTIYIFLLHSDADDVEYLIPILTSTLKVIQYVESHLPHALPEVSSAHQDVSGCFPCLPVIKERGSYTMDSGKHANSCTKLNKGHKSLLPGVFLLHCEHGKYVCCLLAIGNAE